MSLLDRIRGRNVTVENVEPNRVQTVGLDDIYDDIFDKRSQNWVKMSPPKIRPTIKNRRKASTFPTVYGILNNLIMKVISSYVIDGENQEAVDHIIEVDKLWNLRNLMYECLWKCFVDGELFYEIIEVDGHINLRLLAFDGEKALIKKIYDENAQLIGYKQLVVRESALPKWKGVEFWETYQESDVITVDFEVDEVSNPILINIDDVGQSLVKNVIDIAYEVESLTRMMPLIVYKSANILVATMGNADRKETKINKQARDKVATQLSDVHNKGVVIVPYGIELDQVGNPVLPKIEEYIKSLKTMIFEGLLTPESLFSSESSNRSTAQVQLTDPQTGHVLFIEYCQEFLKQWIERTLINPELEKSGYKEGDAYLTFKTTEMDLDTNYLETSEQHNSTLKNEQFSPNGNKTTALTNDPNPYETEKNKNEKGVADGQGNSNGG